MIFGITGMHAIGLTTDIINGIFDPRIELRSARISRTIRLNRIFVVAGQKGMILSRNNSRLIVFAARLLVYDNLQTPHEYHIAVWPIFKIDPDSDRVNGGNPIMIRCSTIKFRKIPERVILFNEGSSLSPLAKPSDIEKFGHWKELYDSSKFPSTHMVHFRLAKMRHELMSIYIYSPNP